VKIEKTKSKGQANLGNKNIYRKNLVLI